MSQRSESKTPSRRVIRPRTRASSHSLARPPRPASRRSRPGPRTSPTGRCRPGGGAGAAPRTTTASAPATGLTWARFSLNASSTPAPRSSGSPRPRRRAAPPRQHALVAPAVVAVLGVGQAQAGIPAARPPGGRALRPVSHPVFQRRAGPGARPGGGLRAGAGPIPRLLGALAPPAPSPAQPQPQPQPPTAGGRPWGWGRPGG